MNIVLFVLLVITVVLLIYFLSKELKTDKMNKSLAISMILLGILQLLIGFLNIGESVSYVSFAVGILTIITFVIQIKKLN
jgi:heme A synthase